MDTGTGKPRRLPWRGSTLVVFLFIALTIAPAFVANLLTPQDATVVTSVEGWNGCFYRVRPGDHLFRIGLRYGVSYVYLAQINGLYNPNYIYAGQVIAVPCEPFYPPPLYSPYQPRPVYPPYKCPWCQPFDIPDGCQPPVQYTVLPGDNLFRIAVNNGSTIQWIRTQNDLWGKVLRPGIVLEVPCPGYVKYPPIPTLTPTPGGGIITATPVTVVPPPTVANTVRMRNKQFRPQRLDVRVGTTVTWINTEGQGGDAYTVTSGVNGQPDGRFSSGIIAPGNSYSYTFNQVGLYGYFSDTDPTTMTGEINVTP